MIGLLPFSVFPWVDDGSRSVYNPGNPAHGPYASEATTIQELTAMQKLGLSEQQMYDCLKQAREERRMHFLHVQNYELQYLEERLPDGRIRIRQKVWKVVPMKKGEK